MQSFFPVMLAGGIPADAIYGYVSGNVSIYKNLLYPTQLIGSTFAHIPIITTPSAAQILAHITPPYPILKSSFNLNEYRNLTHLTEN